MKNIKFLFLSLFLMTLACSDNGFLFRSVGSYEIPEKTGVYYIGEPYEIEGVSYVPKEDYDYFDSGNAYWYEADSNHPLTANGEVFDSAKMTAMHRTLPLPSIVRVTNLNNQASVLVRVNDRGPYDNNRIMDVSKAVADYLNFSKTGVTPVQIEIMALQSQNLKKEILAQKESSSTPSGEVVLNSDKILYPGMNNQNVENLTLTHQKSYSFGEGVMNSSPIKTEPIVQVKSSGDFFDTQKIVYAGSDDTPKYYVQIGAFSQAGSVSKIKRNLKKYPDLFVKDKYKNGQLLHYVRIGPYKTQTESMNVLDKVHISGYPEATIIFE